MTAIEELLKPAEAAKVLQISTATITRCKQAGAPVYPIGTCGRFYLINPREFMEWMNNQGTQAKPEPDRLPTVLELRAARHAVCG